MLKPVKPGATATAVVEPVAAVVVPAAAAAEVTSVDAVAAARTEERARIALIQGHPEAVGRESLARHLALNTDMTAEAAAGILAASPKAAVAAEAGTAAATQETNHFKTAMDNGQQPNVGAGASDTDGENLTPAQRILAAQARHFGKPKVVTAP